MKWAPEILGALFIDDRDYEGILFWYNDIKEQADKIKKDAEEQERKGNGKRK